MPTRILFAILILTNPICCQMFGSAGTVRAEEPVAECGGCACESSKREQPDSSSHRDVPHAPCECPNCELCQCVCAGAVVKDIVSVDDMDGGTPIDGIAGFTIDAPSFLSHRACFCDTPMACGETNAGRAARILHCSLLC